MRRLSFVALAGAGLAVALAVPSAPGGAAPSQPSQPNQPGQPGQPGPYVQPFAGRLSGPVHPPAPPRRTVDLREGSPEAAATDGCDHAYGLARQCVPWQFPPEVRDRCAWLAARGLVAIPVHRRDRHGLDADQDGVACGRREGGPPGGAVAPPGRPAI